jgi:hypothetical protein
VLNKPPEGQRIDFQGRSYIAFHSAPLAGGVFLPTSGDVIEQYLELPREQDFFGNIRDHYIDGVRTPRPGLFAARLSGNSMIDWNIFDGEVVIAQKMEFGYLENGRILVIERHGEEEGTGAWSLKRVVIEAAPRFNRYECDDDIGSNKPTIVLRSHNQDKRFSPWPLDPSAPYWVRGIFRRSLRPEDVRFVDAEFLAVPTAR